MPHRLLLCVFAIYCATYVAAPSYAQAPAAKKSLTAKAYYTASVSAENQKSVTAQGQQAVAISIIEKLVSESESYQDQTLKVRIQTRAADALWNTDAQRANNMFLRAWEIAEKVDQDSERNAKEASKRFMSSRGGDMILIPRVSNLRGEVLRAISLRDPALGEKLLSSLDKASRQEAADSNTENTEASFFDPTQPEPVIAKRLELAAQLLETGEVKLAKSYAKPALNYATSPGIIFLCALRHRDAQEADRLYARLLDSAEKDPAADATTVSLLSTYALTPKFIVTATKRARMSRQLNDTGQAYQLSPELKARFFSVAARILLRPIVPLDQDNTSAGRAGTYFTIARLLPLFEQHAASYVPALNTQLATLAPDAPESFKNGEESMLRVGLTPDKYDVNAPADILSKLVSTVNSNERDALYVKAIQVAMTKGDAEVRDFAEKIEDATLKGHARAFTTLVAVRSAISKKDVAGGLRLVRERNFLPLHRVWARSQLASLVKRTDATRGIQLLSDAVADSKRINLGETERIYAFVCDAMSSFDLDRPRTWELADEAIKAANAVADFSGEDGKLAARLRARNVVVMINSDEPTFNMANLFTLLAKDDLDRAIYLADRLAGETPRAYANLAIARSILSNTSSDSLR